MPVPPTSISAATMTSHAMPMEIRIPVRIVGAAAGRMMVKARRKVPTSSVRATLSHSLRTAATPNAVLISIGRTGHRRLALARGRADELGVFRIHGGGGAAAHGGEMPHGDEYAEQEQRNQRRAPRDCHRPSPGETVYQTRLIAKLLR